MTNNIAIILINEQHSLLPEQKEIINSIYDEIEFVRVPSSGWTLEQIREKINILINKEGDIIFVSPIPAMMKFLSEREEYKNPLAREAFRVFHNDNREKKELPNGKVISAVAKTGWQLV